MDEQTERCTEAEAMRGRLIARMEALFGDDRRRIDHALAVLAHAESIMAAQGGLDGLVVRAAAILHDIGIHAAERKHGSSAGRYQEIEGPPIARAILEELGVPGDQTDHVCRIVANHHSARDIDTPEFRVIWDADWLVNIPDEHDVTDTGRMTELVNAVFKTERGKTLARELFLERNRS